MSQQHLRVLSPLCISFWLLLLCLYFVMPRVNIHSPADSSSPPIPDSQGTKISNNEDSLNIKPNSFTSPAPDGKGESINSSVPVPGSGNQVSSSTDRKKANQTDPCVGRYIYVHELPRRFNEAIIEDCEHLSKARNTCRYLENDGFGQKMDNAEGAFTDSGWYDTDQFTLDVIFNHRIKQYDCLTRNSSDAAAIYVPYYAGFDVSRYIEHNTSIQVRDALSLELVNWLKNTPEWGFMGGKDHFLVAGRITWEFRRLTDTSYSGNQLLLLPEAKNMSTLLIESSPWDSIDFAIPYPTYFHPSEDSEVLLWQERVRKLKREWLFSFAGAPRANYPTSIRGQILDQCKHSNNCKLLECFWDDKRCRSPNLITRMFQSSIFCLQPAGDSATRKSAFDSILAGCIPVFFHPASAYVQYTWHLPKNYSKYSVFIWEDDIRKKNVSIEETLKQISPQRIEEMRAEVIDLIPKIVYADPRSKLRTFKDAFDIAVEGVIKRVENLRRMQISDDYTQTEEVGSHEWDSFLNL